MKQEYVLCVENKGYAASLEPFKIYRSAALEAGEAGKGMTRVIDESGEDYLFPSKYFVSLSLKDPVLRLVSRRYRSKARQKVTA